MLIAGTLEFQMFILVIMRMSGFIFTNPIFGRSNIPMIYKSGFVLLLSVVTMYTGNFQEIEMISPIFFATVLLKEFFVGYAIGLVMNIFEMVLLYAGSVIDMQMGMSMATVYDPTTGSQFALTGTFLRTFYILIFFAVDGHLALIKILITSGEVLPFGQVFISVGVLNAVIVLFTECVLLAAKLALPIIAFEFIMEVTIGILMKIIPQINLFVLSIQLRVLSGVTILVFLISPIGNYIEDLVTDMIYTVQEILRLM